MQDNKKRDNSVAKYKTNAPIDNNKHRKIRNYEITK